MNGTGQNGTRQERRLIGRDCCRLLKIVHEWQMRTGDRIPNGHERYFPFNLGHISVISPYIVEKVHITISFTLVCVLSILLTLIQVL
jgi:hypothetical protein